MHIEEKNLLQHVSAGVISALCFLRRQLKTKTSIYNGQYTHADTKI